MAERIYIVEDHDWLREMLAEYVGQMPGLEVCGAVSSAEEALVGIGGARADLVLVDLMLPGMGGTDLVRQVQQRWPTLPCVVLSAHTGARHVDAALAAGARGYVRKDDPAELERAVRAVLLGDRFDSRAGDSPPPGTSAT